jgi:fumarate hydratase subunit beta
MSTVQRLQLPLAERTVRSLALGDMVTLDGDIVITIGVPTHQRILECIASGKPPPIDLTHAAFFHLSNFSRDAEGAQETLYLGTTTSTRFNAQMPAIIRAYGLRAVGGKGGLDLQCAQAMKEAGCVYLSFLGGASTLQSRSIKQVVAVGWEDLICQFRLVKLRVEQLGPATVAIDAHGNSLYANLRSQAESRLPGILEELARQRSRGPSR